MDFVLALKAGVISKSVEQDGQNGKRPKPMMTALTGKAEREGAWAGYCGTSRQSLSTKEERGGVHPERALMKYISGLVCLITECYWLIDCEPRAVTSGSNAELLPIFHLVTLRSQTVVGTRLHSSSGPTSRRFPGFTHVT